MNPQDWDLGFKAGIWASRMICGSGEGPRRRKRRKKIPLCESISHPFRAATLLPFNFKQNLLRQGMGTTDHLTLCDYLDIP